MTVDVYLKGEGVCLRHSVNKDGWNPWKDDEYNGHMFFLLINH